MTAMAAEVNQLTVSVSNGAASVSRVSYSSSEGFAQSYLIGGRELRPGSFVEVRVVADPESDAFLAIEPAWEIHGVGHDVGSAIQDLREALVDFRDDLERDELRLAPALHEQLAYLRALLRPSA